MIEWIKENVEWFFSGIGILFLTTIFKQLKNNNISKKIFNKVRNLKSNRFIKSKHAFKPYIKAAYKKYSTIKTFGNTKQPLDTKKIYINRNLLYYNTEIKSNDIIDLIKQGKDIIISGNAGAGKSVMLRNLFLQILKAEEFIPILMDLKEYKFEENINLIDFIYYNISKLNFNLKKKIFIDSIKYGFYTFIFDSYDELDNVSRRLFEQKLCDFSIKYSKNNYILSSRPLNFMALNSFIVLEILPLNLSEANQLVSHIQTNKIKLQAEFLRELKEHWFFKYYYFTSNPLMLSMMFRTYIKKKYIPKAIVELYDTIFEVHYKENIIKEISIIDFLNILQSISYRTILNEKVTMNKKDLFEYIFEAKNEMGITLNINQYIDYLTRILNYFVIEDGKYKFNHKSFQEYYAAMYATKFLKNKRREEFLNFVIASNKINILKFIYLMDNLVLENDLFLPLINKLNHKISDLTFQDSTLRKFEIIKFCFEGILINDLHELGYKWMQPVYYSKSKNINGRVILLMKDILNNKVTLENYNNEIPKHKNKYIYLKLIKIIDSNDEIFLEVYDKIFNNEKASIINISNISKKSKIELLINCFKQEIIIIENYLLKLKQQKKKYNCNILPEHITN